MDQVLQHIQRANDVIHGGLAAE